MKENKRQIVVIAGIITLIFVVVGLIFLLTKNKADKDQGLQTNNNSSNNLIDDADQDQDDDNNDYYDNADNDNDSNEDEALADDNDEDGDTDLDNDYDKTDDKTDATNAKLELIEGNSWESGNDFFIQVDATITNNNSFPLDDWLVLLNLPSQASISDSWNINFTFTNGLLSIFGVDYNSSIDANSQTTFGLIIKNPDSLDLSSAKLMIDNKEVASDSKEKPSKSDIAKNNNNNDKPKASPSPKKNNDKPEASPSPKKNNNTNQAIPSNTKGDWLFTKGNKIVNKDSKEVWLTGVNWFGYNTGTNIFDGVWNANLDKSLSSIADRGFNLLRIPFSCELILQWKKGTHPKANYNEHLNSHLKGMNSLEIFDYVVEQCKINGIKIMIDFHSAETDASGHMAPLWYTNKISEADYLDSLSWIAKRYKSDDTIIAYDLKNEPHGAANESVRAIWNDSKDSNNWKYIAEKAALAILSQNPNALVVVEGIQIYPKNIKTNKNFASKNESDYYNTWWGANLRGVKDFPIDLGKYQNKLVYSTHDYGPSVHNQPWFKGSFTMDSLYKDCWRDNWMYIHEDKIAPILIGEWGGFMSSPNLTWMTYLRDYIIKNKLHHTFWCYNANSGDTGGLVLDDFTTWDEEKYKFVKKALWQKNGKFVGLDYDIPLGSNGIALKDY